ADGLLYGAADGLMFKLDTAGRFTTFRTSVLDCDVSPTWCGIASLIQGADGLFYGTRPGHAAYDVTGGDIFRMDSSGAATVLHTFRCRGQEACNPLGLTQGRDGFLYGVTQSGGDTNGGTAFRMDAAGNLVTLHSFDCRSEPCVPSSPLAPARDGAFYGTTRGLDF